MQLKEIFYYALFTVSVAVITYARADDPIKELSEQQTAKRISKREAAIFVIDSFPGEQVTNNKPKRLYKRISKQRFHSKRSYGPSRGRHGPTSPNNLKPRKPYKVKKNKPINTLPYAKKHATKHLSTSVRKNQFKRLPWTTKSPPKKPAKTSLTMFGTQLHRKPTALYPPIDQEPMGFAEPPPDNRPTKHAEVPVDSYGAPLKANIIDPIPKESIDIFENYDIPDANTGPDYGPFNDPLQKDSNIAFFNNFESLAHHNVFDKEPVAGQFSMNYGPSKFNDMFNKKNLYKDMHKLLSNPWIKPMEEEDKVLVGGQYAEPPGRYVPMHHASDILYDDRDRLSTNEMDTESTATVSAYINYKNSNLAFSPQNLNDAFSIDK